MDDFATSAWETLGHCVWLLVAAVALYGLAKVLWDAWHSDDWEV